MNRFDTKVSTQYTARSRRDCSWGLTFFKTPNLHCMSFSSSISHENRNLNTLQSKIFLVADFGL